MAERARQDVAFFPGATASASAEFCASADLQKLNTAPRPVPGAGLLRQLTPSFSPKREPATADAVASVTAELATPMGLQAMSYVQSLAPERTAEEKPTGPFWSLSS